MGDEDIGQAFLFLDLFHQVQDLGLDGYVQGRYGLVAYDELWFHGQGTGNADALPAASVELMRIGVIKPLRQAHGSHQLQYALFPCLFIFDDPVQFQRLRNGLADRHAGIQRRKRILEYDLHLLTKGAHLSFGQRGNIRSVEDHLARSGLQQTQDGPADGGFAAAGFAYDPQGLASFDLKGNVVHGMQHATGRAEIFFQVLHIKQNIPLIILTHLHILAYRRSSSFPSSYRLQATKCVSDSSRFLGLPSRQLSVA